MNVFLSILTHSILFALALPAAAMSLYLLVVTLLSSKPAVLRRSSRQLRFDVIVPAHNEASVIAQAVGNLQKLNWPTSGYRVCVVADNCTDATATIARMAGARVLERSDMANRGKGYALETAIKVSAARGWADAVVVVDADTEASPNLLDAFAARIENGATVIQAHYGVLNAHASWRTRLMCIAMTAFHRVRSRARERLALSCGLRGNGWCITHRQLALVPFRAFSLAEDIEYGIDLGLAGVRVHYADEALVAGAMVSSEKAARSQRQRWESGRFELMRSRTASLLMMAVRGDRVCWDLALDLLLWPLSYVVLNIAVLLTLASVGLLWMPSTLWLWCGFACAACVSVYVLRGWQLSEIGLRGLLDLARAPFFVLWKVWLKLRVTSSTEWVRTKREQS